MYDWTNTALDIVLKKERLFVFCLHLSRRFIACNTLDIHLDALTGAQEYRVGSVFDVH